MVRASQAFAPVILADDQARLVKESLSGNRTYYLAPADMT